MRVENAANFTWSAQHKRNGERSHHQNEYHNTGGNYSGAISGSVIRSMVSALEAPLTRAASSREGSMFWKLPTVNR